MDVRKGRPRTATFQRKNTRPGIAAFNPTLSHKREGDSSGHSLLLRKGWGGDVTLIEVIVRVFSVVFTKTSGSGMRHTPDKYSSATPWCAVLERLHRISRSKIGLHGEGQMPIDASSPRIMTLEDRVITGESHAPTPSYPRPPPGPPPRRRAPASPSEVQGLQTPDLGPGPLGAPAGRRGPDHLVVRRRPTPPRRPLRRDGTPGARGHPARRRHTATTAQRRLGRTLAQGSANAFRGWPSTGP